MNCALTDNYIKTVQGFYSPELNPVENIWEELREKYFHNRVFPSLDAVEEHHGLAFRGKSAIFPLTSGGAALCVRPAFRGREFLGASFSLLTICEVRPGPS